MKNTIYAVAIALMVIAGMSSCRKCKVCTKDSEPEVRVCEGDYGSQTEYGLTIDFYEGAGYNCR